MHVRCSRAILELSSCSILPYLRDHLALVNGAWSNAGTPPGPGHALAACVSDFRTEASAPIGLKVRTTRSCQDWKIRVGRLIPCRATSPHFSCQTMSGATPMVTCIFRAGFPSWSAGIAFGRCDCRARSVVAADSFCAMIDPAITTTCIGRSRICC